MFLAETKFVRRFFFQWILQNTDLGDCKMRETSGALQNSMVIVKHDNTIVKTKNVVSTENLINYVTFTARLCILLQ